MEERDPVQQFPELRRDLRWGVVQRAADSAGFRNCPKLRAFLLYVCENTLAGDLDNVREQLIGAKVFGRSPDYNLREDNIVRVEARELRKRLDGYFEGEGRQEPFLIRIPKGGYVPVFEKVERSEPAPAADPGKLPAPQVSRLGIRLLAAALLLSLGVIVWLALQNRSLRNVPPHPVGARVPAGSADYSIYRDLLGAMAASRDRETQVVLSNPRVVLYFGAVSPALQGPPQGLGIPAPGELKQGLGEALNNQDRGLPYQFLRVAPYDYTGMGEAVCAFHLARLMQYLNLPVRLTQGRFLNWDHVHRQNLIVLGAPQINDWTFRNVTASNFNLAAAEIVNVHPLAGEAPVYSFPRGGVLVSDPVTSYGVIKMLNPPYDATLLILAGSSSAGTAGLGEFFASPEKMKLLHQRIREAAPGKPFPSTWEALLRIEVRDNYPTEVSILAVRPSAGTAR